MVERCEHGVPRATCGQKSPHGGMRCKDRKVLRWDRVVINAVESRHVSTNVGGLGGTWLAVNIDRSITYGKVWELYRMVDQARPWGKFKTLREAKSCAQNQMDQDAREGYRRMREGGL